VGDGVVDDPAEPASTVDPPQPASVTTATIIKPVTAQRPVMAMPRP
jgi:hypothetical protein